MLSLIFLLVAIVCGLAAIQEHKDIIRCIGFLLAACLMFVLRIAYGS